MEFKTKDVIAAIVGDLWGGAASTATAQLSRIAVLQTGILVVLVDADPDRDRGPGVAATAVRPCTAARGRDRGCPAPGG